MVALDFTTMDNSMLSYFKYSARLFQVEEVYFIHIIKMFALPKMIMGEWGPMMQPDYSVDNLCKKQIAEQIKAYNLPLPADKIHCVVHEGRPVAEIAAWSEKHMVDLVIFGNKKIHQGSGITSRRMAHRLKSSMLFIPEKFTTPIQKITVLFDFSTDSIKALLAAIKMYNRIDGVQIRALHVQESTGSQLYPSIGSSQEITALTRERTLAAFDKFIDENGIDKNLVDFVLIDQTDGSLAQTLIEYLSIRPSDLVIMGSVGHSQGHNLLYGSTTESFVDAYLASPILVIR